MQARKSSLQFCHFDLSMNNCFTFGVGAARRGNFSRFYLECAGQKIRLIPPLPELASIFPGKHSFADAPVASHSVAIAIACLAVDFTSNFASTYTHIYRMNNTVKPSMTHMPVGSRGLVQMQDWAELLTRGYPDEAFPAVARLTMLLRRYSDD
jgi:hypothetical protein